MTRPAPDFFHSIQTLRALAALFIVFGHSVDQVEAHAWEWVATLGERGVQIFFVISGFSIEWSKAGRPEQTAFDFTVRRCIRVIPTYWLATLALAVLMWRNGRTFSWTHDVLPSLLMIPHEALDQPGAIYPLLVPGWTLFFESFFYLLFAAGLWLADRWRRPFLTAVLIGLVLLGQLVQPTSPIGITYTSWMLAEFLIGIWLAYAVRRWGLPPAWMGLGIVLGLATFFVGSHVRSAWLEVLGFGLVMTGVLATEGVRAWRWKLLGWIGGAAYSIYIWHSLAMGSLLKRVVEPLTQAWSLGLPAQALLLWITSTLVAALIFAFVDRPMVRWLTQRWKRRRLM